MRQNRVPVAAPAYNDDIYVHREFSEETARIVPNLKLWVTSEHKGNAEQIPERIASSNWANHNA